MWIQEAALKYSLFNSTQLITGKLINVLKRNGEEFMVPESYVNWRAFEYKFQDNPLCINVVYIRNDNLTM